MAIQHNNRQFIQNKERYFYDTVIIMVFVFALFYSAFLLFVLQPMFTKLVLPKLGGSPAVWSVGVVVFQGLLLAGYLYAHILTRYTSIRGSILIHLIIVLAAALALPIGLVEGFGDPPQEGQAIWLLGFYIVSIGAPFFALAGNGPLLQAWFAKSGNAHAHDPYFLYSASNLGSFIALLTYPVVLEPLLALSSQSILWSFGYISLIGVIGVAGVTIWRSLKPALAREIKHKETKLGETKHATLVSTSLRTLWILLSFMPSALMVAITAHLSTDIAAAPFLWVIPLALFLLTFILVFRENSFFSLPSLEPRVALYALPLVIIYAFTSSPLLIALFLNLIFFFIATLACHLRLYSLRPAPEHLTEFYLWMSFGGVLGGAFSALIAPAVFNTVFEYPLLILSTVFLSSFMIGFQKNDLVKTVIPIFLCGSLLIFIIFYFEFYKFVENIINFSSDKILMIGLFFLIAFAIIFLRRRHALTAFIPVIFLYSGLLKDEDSAKVSERSFFGVHKIGLAEEGMFRVLHHGTTLHGAMQVKTAGGELLHGRPIPLTYYHPNGSIAQSLNSVSIKPEGRTLGVVGLGTGAHSCNGKPSDQWSFFEIDPLVVKIAQNKTYFRFLSECAPKAEIILGDAQITLSKQPKRKFDYLLIDAFSSDAIPMHLLTREALKLYLSVLKEDGVLVLHISNRHLELASVVAALAEDAGIAGRIKHDKTPEGVSAISHSGSEVVVLTRSADALLNLDATPGWSKLSSSGTFFWTDNFSNVLSALWRHYTKP